MRNKISIYTNGIGNIGKKILTQVLAYQDHIPAYASTKKYDTSPKKKKCAIIF